MTALTAWSENTARYELHDGYALERAPAQAFALRLTLYQATDPIWNWDPATAVATMAANAWLAARSYWLLRRKPEGRERRVGGVIMWPNTLAALFLEPPFTDLFGALLALKRQLLAWSDTSMDVNAGPVLPDQLDAYLRLGFRVHATSRCMIRPTEPFEVTWDPALSLSAPRLDDEEALTQLFFLAFTDMGLGDQTLEGRRGAVKHYLGNDLETPVLNRASTLVWGPDGRLAGACLVSLWEGWPLIFDLAVHPEHQGGGLATRMLHRALTELASDYPVVRLFVSEGNAAQALYHGLGFRAGPALTNLRLHVSQAERLR